MNWSIKNPIVLGIAALVALVLLTNTFVIVPETRQAVILRINKPIATVNTWKDNQAFGGTGAGLAYQILQSGFQLNIPRMFAALFLISLTGVALFALMAALTSAALGSWHASETSHD